MSRRSGRRRFAFVLAFVVTAAFGTVANAQDDGVVTVSSVSLKGVQSVDESTLKDALGTRRSSLLPWGRKRPFDRRVFEADKQRIVAFYADRGFPDARIVASGEKFNDQNTAVDITVTIAEGDPVRVWTIDFAGFDIVPPDHLDTIKRDIPLRVGRPRDRALVVASRDIALDELRDHGYPYARVVTSETAGPEPGTTTVLLIAEPGALSYFGEVRIAGNTTVGENVIRRELEYRRGDLYRRSVLQNSQRRLYGLALFQFVNVAALNPAAQNPEVSTLVGVTEGKHQRVNASIGYGQHDNVRVDGEYRHVNFLGAARSAGVHGRWSSLDRGIRTDFTQPYFMRARLSLGTEAQRWYTNTPAYSSVVTGARVAITHRRGPNTAWSISVASERSSSSIPDEILGKATLRNDLIALGLDPTSGKQEGTLSAIGFDIRHAATDDVLNPRRGYQVVVHGEEAGILLPGTFNYYALAVDGRHYQPVGDNLVIATRLQIGNIGATVSGEASVPFSKKYFLGGSTTLRGWGRYEVSPLSSGLPIGGNSFLAFSAEARATLKGSLGGVLFLDAGNVWAGPAGFALNDLRYSVGPGFRYQTPVGPIRVDVGYQLNPIPDLRNRNGDLSTGRLRFHFSIGEAF